MKFAAESQLTDIWRSRRIEMVVVGHNVDEIDVVVDHWHIVTHFNERGRCSDCQREQISSVLALILATNLMQKLHEVNALGIGSVGEFPI